MPWYMTEYRVRPNAKYGDWLWARGWKDADRVAKRRGAGEKIIGEAGRHRSRPYLSASQRLRQRKVNLEKAQHALAWVAYLALSSGRATTRQVLGDRGLLHLFAHHCEFRKNREMTVNNKHDRETLAECRPWRLAKMAARIERLIPGYCGPRG